MKLYDHLEDKLGLEKNLVCLVHIMIDDTCHNIDVMMSYDVMYQFKTHSRPPLGHLATLDIQQVKTECYYKC